MIYEVLSTIKVRTKKREMKIQPGQVITIAVEKAQPFIDTGKIVPLEEFTTEEVENMPLEMFAKANLEVKVESTVVGEVILFVSNNEMAKGLKTEGFVIYTADELKKIVRLNPSPETLKAIHEVKNIFPGSKVIQ